MEDQHLDPRNETSGDSQPDPLEQLESRVLAMADALRDARKARRAAETEAAILRDQVQDRDMQVAVLKKQLEGDDLRSTVRARVEALVQRIDELEREG